MHEDPIRYSLAKEALPRVSSLSVEHNLGAVTLIEIKSMITEILPAALIKNRNTARRWSVKFPSSGWMVTKREEMASQTNI